MSDKAWLPLKVEDVDPRNFFAKWNDDVLSECWVTAEDGTVIDHQKVER